MASASTPSSASAYRVTLVAGSGTKESKDGTGTGASFNTPFCVHCCTDGSLLVGEEGGVIRRVIPSTGATRTWLKLPAAGEVINIIRNITGDGYLCTAGSHLYAVSFHGAVIGLIAKLGDRNICGLVVYPRDGTLIATTLTAIYKITLTGEIAHLAGHASEKGCVDGAALSARFNTLYHLHVEPRTGDILVADFVNQRIRKLTVATGVVSSWSGSGGGNVEGTLGQALYRSPVALVMDHRNDLIYLTQFGNSTVSLIQNGTVRTIAGGGPVAASERKTVDGVGTAARFNGLSGACLSPVEAALYVTEENGHVIRRIQLPASVAPVPLSPHGGGGGGGRGGGGLTASPSIASLPSSPTAATTTPLPTSTPLVLMGSLVASGNGVSPCAMDTRHAATLVCIECREHMCHACFVLTHHGTALGHSTRVLFATIVTPTPALATVCALDEKHVGIMVVCDSCRRALCVACDALVHKGARATHKRSAKCETECGADAVVECTSDKCSECMRLCASCDAHTHRGPRASHLRRPIGASHLGLARVITAAQIEENKRFFD